MKSPTLTYFIKGNGSLAATLEPVTRLKTCVFCFSVLNACTPHPKA